MNRILIIDDDRKIRELLQAYLKNHGLEADVAESAEKAHELVSDHNYKLLIVDVMMPGENGIEFTRKIKQSNDIPVLMLTAKSDTSDRITGLESGADDYLPKPFEPKELYLRAMKLMTRYSANSSAGAGEQQVVSFGDLEFNLENHILTKNGERILLSSSEAELLFLFCNNINVSIDRFELAKKFNGISERSVDVQVTRLRKKIEDDPKAPRFIQTSRGKGYVFRI
jgi:two-component system, OmpR family, phosphate regulon response regulator OmpR